MIAKAEQNKTDAVVKIHTLSPQPNDIDDTTKEALMARVSSMTAGCGEKPVTYLSIKRTTIAEFGPLAFAACKSRIEELLMCSNGQGDKEAWMPDIPRLDMDVGIADNLENERQGATPSVQETLWVAGNRGPGETDHV